MTSLELQQRLRCAVNRLTTLVILLFFAFPAELTAEEKLVRYRDIVTTPAGTFGLPVELYLESLSDTEVSIKFAANLSPVQKQLPKLLSAFLVDDCDLRIGLQVDGSQARDDRILINGRLQAKVYTCGKDKGKENRIDLVTLNYNTQAVLELSIVSNCIRLSLVELTLSPTNFASEIAKAIGVSENMIASARATAEEHLESYSGCMEFPEPLRVVDARITSAGIRDFGEGVLGIVIKGRVDTQAEKLVELLIWLFERGHLESEEGTAIGNFSFRAVDVQR